MAQTQRLSIRREPKVNPFRGEKLSGRATEPVTSGSQPATNNKAPAGSGKKGGKGNNKAPFPVDARQQQTAADVDELPNPRVGQWISNAFDKMEAEKKAKGEKTGLIASRYHGNNVGTSSSQMQAPPSNQPSSGSKLVEKSAPETGSTPEGKVSANSGVSGLNQALAAIVINSAPAPATGFETSVQKENSKKQPTNEAHAKPSTTGAVSRLWPPPRSAYARPNQGRPRPITNAAELLTDEELKGGWQTVLRESNPRKTGLGLTDEIRAHVMADNNEKAAYYAAKKEKEQSSSNSKADPAKDANKG